MSRRGWCSPIVGAAMACDPSSGAGSEASFTFTGAFAL